MSDSTRTITLILLILAAATSYIIGSETGMWGFLILGGLFEFTFWIGLLSEQDN